MTEVRSFSVAQLTYLQDQARRLKLSLEDAQEQLSVAQEQLSTVQEQLKAEQEAHSYTKGELLAEEEHVTLAERRTEKAGAEIQDLKQQVKELSAQVEYITVSRYRVRVRNAELRETVTDLKQQLDDLKGYQADRETELTRALCTINEAWQSNRSLRRKVSLLRARVTALEALNEQQ